MSSEELKLMPMPSLGEFIDWVWQLKEDRDAALAQLAAIQGGMGEVVELAKDEQSKSEYWAAAESKAFSIEVPTEVWRAGYAAGCQRITAAMAAEVERLKAEVTRWHSLACNHSRAEDQLRAELAEVKGQEPVLWFRSLIGAQCKPDGRCYDVVFSPCEGFMPLYALPPASPDVEGLVKALEKIAFRTECFAEEDRDMPPHSCEVVAGIAEDALSTWRQAHTPSTLPASSAEE